MKRNLLLEYRVRKLEKLVLEKAIGKLPKYFYHGTLKKNKDSILKYGLTRGNKSDKYAHMTDSDYVYFCGSERKAGIWASQMSGSGKDKKIYPIVIFRIDSSYLDPELIINDINALNADDTDLDPDMLDDEGNYNAKALNPVFNNSSLDNSGNDYQYAGDIPPEALSIVYESDDDTDAKIQDLLGMSGNSDSVDFKAIFKDYDKYKDLKISDGGGLKTVPDILASKLRSNRIPLSKIPVDVLNTILPNSFWPYTPTVLSELYAYDRSYDSAQKLVDLAKTMASIRGLSDYNIELLFKKFLTKPKQTQVMDQIAELPTDFLMKVKPYIAKKYWPRLGI